MRACFIYDCTPKFVLFAYRCTGKERDTESGNDYFGARYYASNMGRFMSPDWAAKAEPVPYAKLDNPQSLNLYGHVGNNPLSGVDPDGHACTAFYGNTQSGFCTRAAEYAQIDADPEIRSKTRFFAAASMVSNALGDADAWKPGTLLAGMRSDARGVLEGIGQNLQDLNAKELPLIANGSMGSGEALDRTLVTKEQDAVTGILGNIKAADPTRYDKVLGEINTSLNGLASKGLMLIAPSDRAYASVLSGVRNDLGRDINFEKQSDREAIGNALIKSARDKQQ